MRPPAGRPWVIAHRGASAAYPENTVAALRGAAALGADGVEFDVRRTSDGVPVVHHDALLPGAGPIVALTLADLRRRAPWVPTLEEALEVCAGLRVDAEVKNSPADPDWDPGRSLGAEVVRRLEGAGRLAQAWLTSFDPGTLARARALAPSLATGWLAEAGVPPEAGLAQAAAAGHDIFLPPASALAGTAGPALVTAAHRAGLRLVCWTLDDPGEARRLAAAGIDGIITNRPDAVARALGASRP